MRILITHQSALLLARWRHHIAAFNADMDVLVAATLTDAYNLAEHQVPDCVVIDEALANVAEFELLASLLGIMRIACLVVSQDDGCHGIHPLHRNVRVIAEQALGAEIKMAIQRVEAAGQPLLNDQHPPGTPATYAPDRLILVGASTGGIDALLTVTRHFDRHCPPTLIVQHTGGRFSSSLIRLLNAACSSNVTAAKDGMPLERGHIYLAPDDQAHLMLSAQRNAQIVLRRDAAVSGHRPSVDALFRSAIPRAPKISAALLTGMGKDGAAGLTELRAAGAHTIGQDRQTSVVYGMPRVAMEMGGVCAQLPITDIGPALLRSCLVKGRA